MKIALPQPEVTHLLNRAAFGLTISPGPASYAELRTQSKDFEPLSDVEPPDLDKVELAMQATRADAIKEFLGKSKAGLMKLNLAWMDRLVQKPSLRERMTFFWHGHFACRTLVPYFAQQLNNTIRANAQGNFRDLLMSVSKDPAMLQFLNNQQNRKGHPNENFARELMELFTLGRGNFTEQDVKEAARAFTGWGFNTNGHYQFRIGQHDFGRKTFRGKTKDFNGEGIIDAILDDKTTALFITRKLYRYFVSDQSIAEQTVREWSDSFYHSDYDIEKLLDVIFQSEEFNRPANRGNRIKSPLDLLIGIQLHTAGKFENPQSMLFLQRALGQIAFYPPNVSGWPSGKAWIDSSSLTFRLTMPMLLFGGVETDFETSDDGDVNGLGKEAAGKKRLHCHVDWPMIADRFTQSSSDKTLSHIENFLLARPATPSSREYVSSLASSSANDLEFVKKAFMGFMSLPEYQMC
jgi:uncharacterized protein (DUF1800 family)